MSQTPIEQFRLAHYLAVSSAAAAVSRTICHPLDTIKISFQRSRTVRVSMHPMQLYRGYVFSTITTIPALSLFLATYEYGKRHFFDIGMNQESSIVSRFKLHMLSAGVAEIVSGFIWTPSEIIKQYMQTSTSTWTRIARDIYHTHGARGFFRGYFYSIGSFLPSSAIYFCTFEELNHRTLKSEGTSFGQLLTNSFVASLFSSAITSPLDLLKTRRQFFHLSPNNAELIVHSFSSFKVRGLLANAFLRCLWNVPSVTISIATYEYLKRTFIINDHLPS